MHLLLLPSRNLLIVIKILVVIIYCWTIYIYLARIILSKSRCNDELR